MRQLITSFFILIASSVCLAQEKYHNDKFGFTLEVPAGWSISFENEWSDKVKDSLKKLYESETLLMLNPSDVKAPKSPCIQIQGKMLKKMTTSEAIADLEKTGKKLITNSAIFLAQDHLGKNIEQYTQEGTFYDYDSTRELAMAKILYQNKGDNTYFLSGRAKFVGLQRVIDFRGYWKGENPEEFWQVFKKVVDSFAFDKDTAPKGLITSLPQEIKEVSKMSKPEASMRFMKLTIGIIIGLVIVGIIIKAILNRVL